MNLKKGSQGDPILIQQTLNDIFGPQIQSINQAVRSFDRRVQRIGQSVSNKFDSQERDIELQGIRLTGLINRLRNSGSKLY